MIREAVILAGGTGSRLQSVVSDRPKCLALINGKPFLTYLLAYLEKHGIERFIFSLGFKHEMIEEFLSARFSHLKTVIVTEHEPLGTGGGIQLACREAENENVLICNGDTLYKINTDELDAFHEFTNADCSIALKPMTDFNRYGAVELGTDSRVRVFMEKQFRESGLINGGVYILNKHSLLHAGLPEKFSFEKDYLEEKVRSGGRIYGCIQDEFFIDIGVPEDYERAQTQVELLNIQA